MKRRTKIILWTLAGIIAGVLATWALLSTRNAFLAALAWPAVHGGPVLARTFADDDACGTGMAISLLTDLIYFTTLGGGIGFLVSWGTTKRET